MDKKRASSNNRNTTKTDLTLLLECLKFQMKSPDLQKQALLTIYSICEKREDNVDLLRELGGVAFIYNLSKSSIVQSDVKATALFTLGTLADANVYCKNSLCRKEIFADITGWLMSEDTPLTQRRVIVYLLLVLVANNKLGQTLAQTSGCLDILLDLFRTSFPLYKGDDLRTVSQTYQFWASVSSTLCGCVNNPQNEEAQRICVAVFPIIASWLQQISLPCTEIFQPICSFIAMTVANNSCVQESFCASGGLKTLTLALVHLASAADTSFLSCQLSVIISKTLAACITDNSVLASSLAQYVVVPHLFSLLASSHLAPDDRLSILLNIGQCTVASVEHQFQLLQCGGLPLIITLLTEDTSEEIKKAATFILQTCKQATMCFRGNSLRGKEAENEEPLANIEGFKSSAQELLRRINLLEKSHLESLVDDLEDVTPPDSTEGQGHPSQFRALSPPLQRRKSRKTIHTLKHVPQGSDKLQKSEIRRAGEIPAEEQSGFHIRCAGCVLPFEEVTSRTFSSLQSLCHNSCDMHRVLQEATEQFRVRCLNGALTKKHQHVAGDSTDARRRKRQEFSREEVGYLLSGVNKYGFSWNSILWSYPFQPGRISVDLAKKYGRLMKCKDKDDSCI
ncbi:telomere repeats-binding bouquet formation protein 1 [Xenentodon cancila]